MEDKIEYFRTNPRTGVRLEIISKKGYRNYHGSAFSKREDRLFFIKLSQGDVSLEFPFSYSEQHRMMELVMNNIILEGVFEKEYKTFLDLMESIKKNRKKDVNLSDFENESP